LNTDEKSKWVMRNKFIKNKEILSSSQTGKDLGLIFKNQNESPKPKVKAKHFKTIRKSV